MKHDSLRFLDKYFGLPLCVMLTLVRYFFRAIGFRSNVSKTPRRVLIIKLSEMGSSVLSYPAFQDIRRQIKDVELYFLVFAQNRPVLDAMKVAPPDHLIAVRTTNVGALAYDGMAALWKMLALRVDATIDMDFFSRFTAALAFLVCRGRRVGFHPFTNEGLSRGDLLTHRVIYNSHRHTSLAFLSLTRSLTSDPNEIPLYKDTSSIAASDLPSYQPSPESVENVGRLLAGQGLPAKKGQRPLILLNPNSSGLFVLRKWPLTHFSELCQLILKKMPDADVAVTGSSSEQADALHIASAAQNPRCVSVAGKTSFPELLALYARANLLITNDSGPAHFASILRLPTLVFFGPETPFLYEPLGGACKSLYSHYACSPCVSVYNNKKSPCQDNKCLQVISPAAVLDEVAQILRV